MIKQNIKIFASFLLFLISYVSYAQLGDNPPPPMPPPPVGLPIDGPVVYVLVLAIIYGMWKKVKLTD